MNPPVPSSRPKFSITVNGGFTPVSFKSLGMKNKTVLETLVCSHNASLAKASWSKYGTAEQHKKGAEKLTGVSFSYRFTKERFYHSSNM